MPTVMSTIISQRLTTQGLKYYRV